MNDIVYAGKHAVTFRVPRHEHDTWELIYCTDQEGELRFDDFSLPYAKGTVAVIPPYTPHSNVSQNGFTNIHVNLADATLNFPRPVAIQDDGNRSILSVFTGIFFQYYENAEQRETLLAAYGNLLAAFLLTYRETSSLSRVVQQIESVILSPRLMSGATGLHPAWVLLLLSGGGLAAGLTGMLLALPLFVCLRGAARAIQCAKQEEKP